MEYSVAEAVKKLIDADPSLKECLEAGIINYTRMAKKLKPMIEKILEKEVSVEAIKASLIRYSKTTSRPKWRPGVLRILARSVLEIRTGISAVTVRIHMMPYIINIVNKLLGRARFLAVIQGLNNVTLIVSDEHYGEILDQLGKENVVEEIRGESALVIISPKEIIRTPGFLAYIMDLLGRNGINVLQAVSYYTETMILVSSDDLMKAFKIISDAIQLAKYYVGLNK